MPASRFRQRPIVAVSSSDNHGNASYLSSFSPRLSIDTLDLSSRWGVGQTGSKSSVKGQRAVHRHADPDDDCRLREETYTRWLQVLLLLVGVAALGCFGTAYYLHNLSTRRSLSTALRSAQASNRHDVPSNYVSFDGQFHRFSSLSDGPTPSSARPQVISGDKYLSYLPHSGFHNQRIALENALVLAALLNRTLLVPPIHLTLPSKLPLRYVASEKLRRFVGLSGKDGLWHCAWAAEHRTDLGNAAAPDECREYGEVTWLSWEWLVGDGFARLQEEYPSIRFLPRWDLSDAFLADILHLNLNLTSTHPESDTIYTLSDSTAYDHRFVDMPSHTHEQRPSKFAHHLHIPSFAKHTADVTLLQLGTLFGSSRLRLRTPEAKRLRSRVRGAMAFRNKELVGVAGAISEALRRERGFYWGAHVRVGDGVFREDARERVWGIRDELVQRVSGYFPPSNLAANSSSDLTGLRNDSSPTELCHLSRHPPGAPKGTCSDAFLAPLYISTDASPHLRTRALSSFHDVFPSIFYLSDFILSSSSSPGPAGSPSTPPPPPPPPPPHIHPTDPPTNLQTALAALASLRSAYDGLPLLPFLLPFIEALVVAGAREVVGTPGSTFSAFVEDVLWREGRGEESVERG